MLSSIWVCPFPLLVPRLLYGKVCSSRERLIESPATAPSLTYPALPIGLHGCAARINSFNPCSAWPHVPPYGIYDTYPQTFPWPAAVACSVLMGQRLVLLRTLAAAVRSAVAAFPLSGLAFCLICSERIASPPYTSIVSIVFFPVRA